MEEPIVSGPSVQVPPDSLPVVTAREDPPHVAPQETTCALMVASGITVPALAGVATLTHRAANAAALKSPPCLNLSILASSNLTGVSPLQCHESIIADG